MFWLLFSSLLCTGKSLINRIAKKFDIFGILVSQQIKYFFLNLICIARYFFKTMAAHKYAAMAMNHLLFFCDTLLFLDYMYWTTHIANDNITIHGKKYPNTVSNAEITHTISCP